MGLLSSLGTARAGSVVRAAAQTSIKMEADDEAMISSSGSFKYLPRGSGRSSYGTGVSSCSMFLLPKNELLRSQCMSHSPVHGCLLHRIFN